jgi:pimeloyl-ACP methyl ester carboxylesterase
VAEPTLVCLHGLGGSAAEWADAVRELRADATFASAMPAAGAVVLLGHSFGAVRALQIAATQTDRVDAVVLTGCFFPPARGGRTLAETAADYGRHRLLYVRDVVSRRRTRAPRPSPADARRLASLARLGLRPGGFHRLADGVQCPVLVVHGDRDHVVPIGFARAAAAAHPDWTLREVQGGGHFVHRDRAHEWAVIVGGWLHGLRDP